MTFGEAASLSQHPLSNDETSQLDQALYGQWDIFGEQEMAKERPPLAGHEEEAPTTEPPPDPAGPPRVAIGKLADKERTHEMVLVAVQDDGSIEINARGPGHIAIPRDTRPTAEIVRDIECRVPLEVVGSRIQARQPVCQ